MKKKMLILLSALTIITSLSNIAFAGPINPEPTRESISVFVINPEPTRE